MKSVTKLAKPLSFAMATVFVFMMLASCGKSGNEASDDAVSSIRATAENYNKWVNDNPFLDENRNFTITPVLCLGETYVRDCSKKALSVTVSEKITDDTVVTAAKSPTIQNYIVDEKNERYVAVDGVIFTRDLKTLILFPTGRTGEYKIPDGTEAIGSRAFAECAVSRVEIPAGVKTVGDEAFAGCALKEIKYPAGVTSMGTGVFMNVRPDVIEIPEGTEEIAPSAFCGVKARLAEINVPSSVKKICGYAFAEAEVAQIYVPDGDIEIAPDALAISGGIISLPKDFKSSENVEDSFLPRKWNGRIDMHYDNGTSCGAYVVDPMIGIIYRGTRAEWLKLSESGYTCEEQVLCTDDK